MLNLCESIYLCYPHCSPLIRNTLNSEKISSPLGITRKTYYIVAKKVTELLQLQCMAGVAIRVTRYSELVHLWIIITSRRII
jgi:hypothetical protein